MGTSSTTHPTRPGGLSRLLRLLPEGNTLPHEIWLQRHRALLALLWLQAVGLVIYGIAQGVGVAHALQEGGIVAALAAAAMVAKNRPRLASTLVSVGMMSVSAVLVHLSNGLIEAHFHFFVVLLLLTLYEDWVPFLIAGAYVLLHHGIAGTVDPSSVYNHPDAIANPWKWAGIHALFVSAAGAAGVTAWKLNESYRAQTVQRAEAQGEVAQLGEQALAGDGVSDLMRGAIQRVVRVVGADVAAVLEHVDETSLLVRAAEAPGADMIGARVPTGKRSQAGYTLLSGHPVIVDDWREETRFEQPEVLQGVRPRSGATVLIRGSGKPFGVLGVQSMRGGAFGANDINFLQSVAHVLATAIERRTVEERIKHQAVHDPLTGLPNRNLFTDRLEHALAHSNRRDSSVAVLFCDLDQFKLVNDSHGHQAGDELLCAVAPRIADTLRGVDTVARFGGDEFGIMIEEVETERDAIRAAERIGAALARPFILRGREHFVTATIGIAIGRGHEPPAALIRDADAAMYRAKERGRGRYEMFDDRMRWRAVDHLRTENDLRLALERDELRLHYQPIVSLDSGTLAGLEALLRWEHPERGLLGPGEFMGVAEESGLIVPLGRWVLKEACRQAALWHQQRPDDAPVGISVNLSARQVNDSDLLRVVQETLSDSGVDPLSVSLEVTETALLDDASRAHETLTQLRELGPRLALDDFGTGFASLDYLRRLPFDSLKVDRSFIERLGEHHDDAAIVGAIIGIADALDLTVVAEGVETQRQLQAIRALGCKQAQGFLFARPMPAGEVDDVLSSPPASWHHSLAST